VKVISSLNKIFIPIFALLAILLFTGISLIPFHPDEVSLLYQSRDFEQLFTNPMNLAYKPERDGEIDQTYRAMNPPLPKYILAIGRLLAGYDSQSVSVDWNWSLTWDQNEAAGALPDPDLLNASRTASTVMVLLTLPILYLCGKKIKNSTLGISAVLLLGTHSLVLLHGRRAMAEGTLLFGISLAILGVLEGNKRPWLAGIGTAVAACSKMSAAALAPVGFLSVLWLSSDQMDKKKTRIQNSILFVTTFLAIYFLLNPFLWSNPIEAFQSQWYERTQFLQGMIEEMESLSPNQILNRPLDRAVVMVANLFITDPQFAEVGNYIANTSPSEKIYLAHFQNNLFRGWAAGILMITLTVSGIVSFGIDMSKSGFQRHRRISLLLIASIIQTISLIWANPLSFQRYAIPLVPFICLWIGYFIALIIDRIKQATSPEK
jgi:4-amino-4-deoxy-L-arabinose transferase-like glycosyltransferase